MWRFLLVVTSPILFLVCLMFVRTGRNLTTLFLVGSGGLFCLGLFLIVLGARKRRRESILSGSGLLSVLLVTFCAGNGGVYWIGSTTRELTILVRDADTAEPIPNATVRLRRLYAGDNTLQGTTGMKGAVDLVREFTCIGTDSAVRRTGAIYLWEDGLEVDAEGYKPLREPLEKFADSTWNLYGPPLPVIDVSLKKEKR